MNLLKGIPAGKKFIIRAILASALDVNKIYRMLKGKKLRAQTNNIKSKLNHRQKMNMLHFVLN